MSIETKTQDTSLAKSESKATAATASWSPWGEVAELRQRMDNLFSRAFGHTPLSHLIPPDWSKFEPQVDIHETETGFEVLASLPGYQSEQIAVEATDTGIQVRGKRPSLSEKTGTTHRDNGVAESSSFQFAYTLPTPIDPSRAKARFENGVLRLELPKTEKSPPRSVPVAIQ